MKKVLVIAMFVLLIPFLSSVVLAENTEQMTEAECSTACEKEYKNREAYLERKNKELLVEAEEISLFEIYTRIECNLLHKWRKEAEQRGITSEVAIIQSMEDSVRTKFENHIKDWYNDRKNDLEAWYRDCRNECKRYQQPEKSDTAVIPLETPPDKIEESGELKPKPGELEPEPEELEAWIIRNV